MATVNNRIMKPQASVINGVDAGGTMIARIASGYDDVNQTPLDGLDIPLVDRLTEFVRGSLTCQDWVHIIDLLTGTVGTYVFYQRKSGTAVATGFIKHTITNPVIHRAALSLIHRGYGTINADFECKAADESKGISDMWGQTDDQAAPSYISAARGLEITACAHNSVDIYHTIGLDFEIAMQLMKASADGDVGYTAVDAELGGAPQTQNRAFGDPGGISPMGTLTFQDASITDGNILAQDLIAASAGDLVLTVKQAQGAAAKTVTIANVVFTGIDASPSADGGYTDFSMPFVVANDADTPLTLAGDNKIITIA